jgi:hypothetical protein
MNSDTLFVLNRGKLSGPYSLDQLQAMRTSGVCSSFTRVSTDKSNWRLLDEYLVACKAEAARPAPLRPPPMSDGGPSPIPGTSAQLRTITRSASVQRSFPVFPLLLLHYLTLGIFSFFWITGMHGRLPRMKSDDLSAGQAIGFCFIPFYNLYWIFRVYPRLATRVNALSRQYSLLEQVPAILAYSLCVLAVIPVAMMTAGCLIVMMLFFSDYSLSAPFVLFFLMPNLATLFNYLMVFPLFAGLAQKGINQVSDAQLADLINCAR